MLHVQVHMHMHVLTHVTALMRTPTDTYSRRRAALFSKPQGWVQDVMFGAKG